MAGFLAAQARAEDLPAGLATAWCAHLAGRLPAPFHDDCMNREGAAYKRLAAIWPRVDAHIRRTCLDQTPWLAHHGFPYSALEACVQQASLRR